MTALSKQALQKAKAELVAAGWAHVSTVCTADGGLRYGLHFTKDGATFYLNKDTYLAGMTGDAMAEACRPIFN